MADVQTDSPLLEEEGTKLTGEVEADETYIGGKDENRHPSKKSGSRGRGDTGKTIVAGTVERKTGKGRVIATVVPNVQAQTLLPLIQANVAPDSTVYTDEHAGYNRVAQLGYEHRRIYHASKVYVLDNVHTNTIEGFGHW